MVHALGQVHKLLQPDGYLINVNDLPTPNVIEVQSPETIYKLGWLQDREDFRDTLAAFNALAQVVADGFFMLEDERDLDYNIYVDDLPELQAWLAEWWSSAILPDSIIQRIEELFREASQPARIVLRLRARMIKLRAA
jgi:hypothetical protein